MKCSQVNEFWKQYAKTRRKNPQQIKRIIVMWIFHLFTWKVFSFHLAVFPLSLHWSHCTQKWWGVTKFLHIFVVYMPCYCVWPYLIFMCGMRSFHFEEHFSHSIVYISLNQAKDQVQDFLNTKINMHIQNKIKLKIAWFQTNFYWDVFIRATSSYFLKQKLFTIYFYLDVRSAFIVFNDFSNRFKSLIWWSVRCKGGVKPSMSSTNLSLSSTPFTNWMSVWNNDWIDDPLLVRPLSSIFFVEIVAIE